MSTGKYQIRTMTRDELDLAVDWAAAEGWNPGLDDAECFFQTDPSGFLVGLLDDQPIGSISVVKYENHFGFLGFYIIRQEYRNQGYGYKLWQAGMETLAGRNIGLDGVVAQQDNYRKSGFSLAWRNIRYAGYGGGVVPDCDDIVDIASLPLETIVHYDRRFFPAQRNAFLTSWSRMKHGRALGILSGKQLTAYGVIRQCRNGYKIGPLFADNAEAAEKLFLALKAPLTARVPVYLDVPENNLAAVRLAEKYRMGKVFETARMYTGEVPKMELSGIFGITSFELG
ncbi:MAG: GNAT family N-acetyltransferase [Victivallales bacterium]|nr:GNAT family N-acetyltransferase [Victivallales bacterium]